jgi:hypothetical protein
VGVLLKEVDFGEDLFLIGSHDLLAYQVLKKLAKGSKYEIQIFEIHRSPLIEELYLLGLVGRVADVVQQVAVAVYDYLGGHEPQGLEDVIGFLAETLLLVGGCVHVRNFSD